MKGGNVDLLRVGDIGVHQHHFMREVNVNLFLMIMLGELITADVLSECIEQYSTYGEIKCKEVKL